MSRNRLCDNQLWSNDVTHAIEGKGKGSHKTLLGRSRLSSQHKHPGDKKMRLTTLTMPRLTTSDVMGAKKPKIVYPAIGVDARRYQVLFQIIAHPAITGKQQNANIINRMLRTFRLTNPTKSMPMKQTPPSGICHKSDS